jgi:hypothetical protein
MSKRIALTAMIFSSLSFGAIAADPAAKPPTIARPTATDVTGQAAYAWFLFTQAMAPSNGSLTFETWNEQCQLNPAMAGCPPPSAAASKAGRILHSSGLARKQRGKVAVTSQSGAGAECNAMTTSPLNGYPPPANVVSTAQFCEEVYVNPPEATFVTSNGLTTLTGQQTYGSTRSNAITFPWTSIEVKADWVPAASFSNPTFNCPDTTNTLYTETINGTCYALVGLHISSKVLPDWLWATFEPASVVTNPNRCDPKLYDTCFDPWGTNSKTPYAKGQTVAQSAQLKALMAAANLNPAFNNYFLTGVQTKFVDAKGAAIPLGSSFVEFNAGVPPGQASCITCHRYAYYDGTPTSPEDNFGGPPNGWPAIGYACNTGQKGNCTPVVPKSTSQDFSWMLGLMPAK